MHVQLNTELSFLHGPQLKPEASRDCCEYKTYERVVNYSQKKLCGKRFIVNKEKTRENAFSSAPK